MKLTEHGVVHLSVIVDADAVVAYAEYLLGDRVLEVTGSAKREPGDNPDGDIGRMLAVSRALGKLERKIARLAAGRISGAAADKKRVHKPLAEWQKEKAAREGEKRHGDLPAPGKVRKAAAHKARPAVRNRPAVAEDLGRGGR